MARNTPAWQGPGTRVDVDTVAAKLDDTTATYSNNYWSPLSCLVEERENNEEKTPKTM